MRRQIIVINKMKGIRKLVNEITHFLEQYATTKSEKEIVTILKNLYLEQSNFFSQEKNTIPKETSLIQAISLIEFEPLLPIKRVLGDIFSDLTWNIDNGTFYRKNSKIGEQYINGNMHTEIIGPINGSFKCSDLRLGLFLLEPNIFYKDHKHEASELYLNLTSGTDWRFEGTSWQEKQQGSVLYNEPYKVHAMRTHQLPFLSVWCWSANSSKKCILVSRGE